jgi:hypothetical protein
MVGQQQADEAYGNASWETHGAEVETKMVTASSERSELGELCLLDLTVEAVSMS